jgi:O-antigen/teichoic acid export membrane protein
LSNLAARVARNVAWLGLGEVALKGGLFGAGVVVARGLGPSGMGAFTVAYAAALVLMQVLAGGQVEVLIRETARYPEHGRDLFLLARSYQWRIAAMVVPLAAAGALLVSRLELRWTLVAFIPYAFLRRWLITAGAVFKGLDRMDVEVLGRALELAIALPCLALVSASRWPVWATGIAFSLGGLGAVIWITIRLRQLPLGTGAVPVSRSMLVGEGRPFLANSMVGQLVMRSDSFLLAALGIPASGIGHYGVGAAPAQGLGATSQVIAVATYPSLSRAAAAGTLRPRPVLLLAAAGLLLGAALASLLFLLREPIVNVFFGTGFADSTRLLAVLAWGLPGACTAMLTGAVLAATRRQRWALVSQSVMLMLTLTAYLLVIPHWGVAGCAVVSVASVSSIGLINVVLALAATRRGEPVAAGPAVLALVEGAE